MSLAVKRKRGRPRNDEPREINEFDLTLIEEFRSRPAFYDRTHPQYRNREFLEPQWLEMSRNLGYNVSLVKNRMIQLRNRYNLEKRRVDSLREQYNDPDITSQWILYPNLTFLGTHIKSRRTFTKQELQPKKQPASNSSDDADDDSQQFENGHTTDHQSDINSPPPPPQPQDKDPIATAAVAAADEKKSESNNYTTVPTFVRIPLNATVATSSVVSTSNSNSQSQSQSNGSDKFKAFGQFLASSLIEMDEKDALRLVEKFTSDLCKSLLSVQRSNLKHLSGNGDTEMGGISVYK